MKPPATQAWIVTPEEAGVTLDKFLAPVDRLGSRSKAAQARTRGKVFLNGAEATPQDASRRLAAGDEVRVWGDRPGSARRVTTPFTHGDLRVIYEDPYFIVINKPAGLLAVPLPERKSADISLVHLVREHLRSQHQRTALIVHRIDRDTSGLVVFAKDARTQAALKEQFRQRTPERVYLAIVYGHPAPPEGTWRDHLVWDGRALIQKETHPGDPKAREAISHYRVIERYKSASAIEVRLHTGKRNQIRIQARLRGHTLVGEVRYTYGPDELRPIPFGRQALHAWRLRFEHPTERRPIQFEAPIPEDMKELMGRLR